MSAFFMTGCAPAFIDATGTITVRPQPSDISAASTDADSKVNNEKLMLILKKQDNGKETTVRRGDIIQIELERSGGTGYEWYLDEAYKAYFDLLKEDKEENLREGFVGAPVITRWQLKAVKQGTTELKLFLYRDWEGKDRAASLFQVKVKIR